MGKDARPRGSVIGIMGGGQLGRMTAIEAARLGYSVHVYSPDAPSPAAEVSLRHTHASFEDEKALTAFAQSVDVITCEMEHVPASALKCVEQFAPLYPKRRVFEICQDRVAEKSFLKEIGIPTAGWLAISHPDQIRAATKDGWQSGILKTAFAGYDGKGQVRLDSPAQFEDADAIWETLFGANEHPPSAVLEQIIAFDCEISVVVARNSEGQIAAFDTVENDHKNHILSVTHAPARISDQNRQKAMEIASKIAEALDIQGILAVEMFVATTGEILVNELAPRPHNSGHWAMNACNTDQFKLLVRALCNLPMTQPVRFADAEMINLIGDDIDKTPEYLKMPNAHVHLYGKKDVRVGRKMGHVNIVKPLTGNRN